MNRSRARRFRHITWLPMTAAVAVTASVPLLGCFEEDQTLGNDTDSGVPGSGTGSGTPLGTRDSGTGHHDSGVPGSGTGGGACGDGVCGSDETCSSCPIDCGACDPGRDAGGGTCGDGVCGGGESCSSCPADCGACDPGRDAGNPGVDGGTSGDAGPPAYCPTTQGTSGTVLVSGQTRLGPIDIDTSNLYWVSDLELNAGGNILTIAKTGAGSPVTLATNQPSAFALAATSSTLYWSSAISSETPSDNFAHVMSIPLPATGSATPSVFWGESVLETSFPYAFVADSSDLYWYNIGYTGVYAAPLDGATALTISSPFPAFDDSPVGLGVDSANIYALWYGELTEGPSTPQSVSLTSVPKTGGDWSTLWSAPAGDSYTNLTLFADTTGVYWVVLSGGSTAGEASIWSLPAGGIPTQLASGLTQPTGLVGDGVNLYYGDQANLWRLPITGGTPSVFAANEYSGAIRIDSTYVYWANGCTGTIKKLAK